MWARMSFFMMKQKLSLSTPDVNPLQSFSIIVSVTTVQYNTGSVPAHHSKPTLMKMSH
jgi:hypothetical protein